MNKTKKNITKISVILIMSITIIIFAACTDNTDYASGEHSVNANPRNVINQSFIVKSPDHSFLFQGNDKKITRLNNSDKVVYDNTLGEGIMIYDNYVYYRNEGESSELMRFLINIPDEKLVISKFRTFNPIIVDDMIYATFFDNDNDKFGLYRMNLDGSKKKKLADGKIMTMQYYEGYIYYSSYDDLKLFRIDLNGNNQEMLLWNKTGEFIKSLVFIIDSDWIYFTNMNYNGDGENTGAIESSMEICRISLDGSDFEELTQGYLHNSYMNSDDDEYLIFSDEENVYTMNLGTREVQMILNKRASSICVINNNLFVLHTESETLNSIIYQINMETYDISVVGE